LFIYVGLQRDTLYVLCVYYRMPIATGFSRVQYVRIISSYLLIIGRLYILSTSGCQSRCWPKIVRSELGTGVLVMRWIRRSLPKELAAMYPHPPGPRYDIKYKLIIRSRDETGLIATIAWWRRDVGDGDGGGIYFAWREVLRRRGQVTVKEETSSP